MDAVPETYPWPWLELLLRPLWAEGADRRAAQKEKRELWAGPCPAPDLDLKAAFRTAAISSALWKSPMASPGSIPSSTAI